MIVRRSRKKQIAARISELSEQQECVEAAYLACTREHGMAQKFALALIAPTLILLASLAAFGWRPAAVGLGIMAGVLGLTLVALALRYRNKRRQLVGELCELDARLVALDPTWRMRISTSVAGAGWHLTSRGRERLARCRRDEERLAQRGRAAASRRRSVRG